MFKKEKNYQKLIGCAGVYALANCLSLGYEAVELNSDLNTFNPESVYVTLKSTKRVLKGSPIITITLFNKNTVANMIDIGRTVDLIIENARHADSSFSDKLKASVNELENSYKKELEFVKAQVKNPDTVPGNVIDFTAIEDYYKKAYNLPDPLYIKNITRGTTSLYYAVKEFKESLIHQEKDEIKELDYLSLFIDNLLYDRNSDKSLDGNLKF